MEPMLNDRLMNHCLLQRPTVQSWLEPCHQDRTTDPRKKASLAISIAYATLLAFIILGADGETRTRTGFRPLPPQDSVSTNFTTSALSPLFYIVTVLYSMQTCAKTRIKQKISTSFDYFLDTDQAIGQSGINKSLRPC